MNKINSKSWYYLTFLIFISLHLKVSSVGGFDVALALLLIPIWVYITYKIDPLKYTKKEVFLLFSVFTSPLVTFFFIEDWIEFFKTYIQFTMSYYLFARTILKPIRIDFEMFKKLIFNFQRFLFIIVLLQFFLVEILGLEVFYNLFGSHQLYYQHNSLSTSFRMKAFYLEPSFLGFIIINIYWARLRLKPKTMFESNFFFTLILLFFTKSSFANLAFILIFLFEFYSNKNLQFGRVIKFLSIFVFIFLAYSSFEVIYSFLRLNEINSVDNGLTSGYMRVVLPFEIVFNMFFVDGYFFGIPFGQLDNYIQQFMQENYQESSVNNAFFAVICYWGILGLAFYFYLFTIIVKHKDKLLKSLVLLFLINLNNSGAFATMQFVFVALIVPLLTIQIIKNNSKKQKNDYIYNYSDS